MLARSFGIEPVSNEEEALDLKSLVD